MDQKKENQDCRKKGRNIYQKPVLMDYNIRRAVGGCVSGSAAPGPSSSCGVGTAPGSACSTGVIVS